RTAPAASPAAAISIPPALPPRASPPPSPSLHRSAPHPHLHSFPTRRSSDLRAAPFQNAAAVHILTHYGDQAHRFPQSHQVFADVDRKSTRLNSSHVSISYAVFCLKKKTSLLPLMGSGAVEHRVDVTRGTAPL